MWKQKLIAQSSSSEKKKKKKVYFVGVQKISCWHMFCVLFLSMLIYVPCFHSFLTWKFLGNIISSLATVRNIAGACLNFHMPFLSFFTFLPLFLSLPYARNLTAGLFWSLCLLTCPFTWGPNSKNRFCVFAGFYTLFTYAVWHHRVFCLYSICFTS